MQESDSIVDHTSYIIHHILCNNHVGYYPLQCKTKDMKLAN